MGWNRNKRPLSFLGVGLLSKFPLLPYFAFYDGFIPTIIFNRNLTECEGGFLWWFVPVSVCVCVCVREKEKEHVVGMVLLSK